MSKIFEKANSHIKNKLPFVLYCKPNTNMIFGLFQTNDNLFEIKNYEEKGFALVSFDGESKYIIPEKESELVKDEMISFDCPILSTHYLQNNLNSKQEFIDLVANGINAIKNNEFEKVVLSRLEIIDKKDFDFEKTFKRILFYYTSTFRYCFYHPKIGFWMGASPEQFLQSDQSSIKTVALAGTQTYHESEKYIWKQKEIKEQKYVTDYILEIFYSQGATVVSTNPYTFRAGGIVHLKTDIKATFNVKDNFKKIIKKLHPTPAVCGLPKAAAKKFILENELYKREFYTGFLGELNFDFNNNENSDLFVNLRCMKIKDNLLGIYVGCGITNNSIPEHEFMETVNKSQTIKKIL